MTHSYNTSGRATISRHTAIILAATDTISRHSYNTSGRATISRHTAIIIAATATISRHTAIILAAQLLY